MSSQVTRRSNNCFAGYPAKQQLVRRLPGEATIGSQVTRPANQHFFAGYRPWKTGHLTAAMSPQPRHRTHYVIAATPSQPRHRSHLTAPTTSSQPRHRSRITAATSTRIHAAKATSPQPRQCSHDITTIPLQSRHWIAVTTAATSPQPSHHSLVIASTPPQRRHAATSP